ncbi:MAG: hypothetical protein ACYCS0_00860 [bacterium]
MHEEELEEPYNCSVKLSNHKKIMKIIIKIAPMIVGFGIIIAIVSTGALIVSLIYFVQADFNLYTGGGGVWWHNSIAYFHYALAILIELATLVADLVIINIISEASDIYESKKK